MKKQIFSFLFVLFLSFNSVMILNGQNYSLFLTLDMPAATINKSGDFQVSRKFDGLFRSIEGVTKTSYELGNSDGKKILLCYIKKDSVPYTIAFEIGTSSDIQAMKGQQTITHTCIGSCRSGVLGAITYCSYCEFDKDAGGKIIGCKCENSGCCVHSITATEVATVLPQDLRTYIKREILK